MKKRVLVPERMDDPTLSECEHVRALRGLRRINRWTRNARAAWLPIRELARTTDPRQLSVLDIATGGADVPIKLCRYASAANIRLDIDACDVSSTALSFATRSLPEQTHIHLYPLDIGAGLHRLVARGQQASPRKEGYLNRVDAEVHREPLRSLSRSM